MAGQLIDFPANGHTTQGWLSLPPSAKAPRPPTVSTSPLETAP